VAISPLEPKRDASGSPLRNAGYRCEVLPDVYRPQGLVDLRLIHRLSLL
jgi:hypothetical protein